MEGVIGAVLLERSSRRDTGFLGRLALDVLARIDAAHASPVSDPDVLSLVVEELEVCLYFIFFHEKTPRRLRDRNDCRSS